MAKVNSYQNDVSISAGDKLTGSNEEGYFRQYPIGDLLSYFQANLNFAEGTDGIQSIVAGTGISVDDTDPLNPIVTCTVTGGTTQSLQEVLDIGNSSITDAEFVSGAKVLLTDQATYSPILGSQFEMNIVDTTSGNLYNSLKYIRKSNGTGSESSIADYNYMENNGTVDSGFTRAVWNHTRDTNTGVPTQLIGADNLVQFRNSNTSGAGSVELITANENTAALQDYGFNGTIQNVIGSRSQVQVDVPDATILDAYVLMSELDLSDGSTINNWVGLQIDVTQTVGQGTILGGAFIELAVGIDETMATANGIKAIDSKINLPSFFQGEVELANGLKFNADNTIKLNGDELIEVAGDAGVLLSSGDGLSLLLADVFEFKGSTGISIYNQSNFYAFLDASNLTATRTLQFPDASGTIALTSDIVGTSIPDTQIAVGTGTGVEGDANFIWDGNNFQINNSGTTYSNLTALNTGFYRGRHTLSNSNTSNKLILDGTGDVVFNFSGSYSTTLKGVSHTSSYTQELQAASGTIALTSDIVTLEGYSETGTIAGGDLIVKIGDHSDSYTGTKITIDIDNEQTIITGELLTPTITVQSGTYGATIGSNNLTGGRNLELPDASGTLALTSDITASELLAVDSTQNADFDVTDAMTSGMVKVDSATDITVTVRDFATHPIPVGSVIAIMQANAGTITVNYTGSATGDALKTFRDGDVLSLWHEAEDKWVVINPPHAIDSTTVNEPAGSDQVLNIVTLTQAEYDAAVGTYNADTLYIITS